MNLYISLFAVILKSILCSRVMEDSYVDYSSVLYTNVQILVINPSPLFLFIECRPGVSHQCPHHYLSRYSLAARVPPSSKDRLHTFSPGPSMHG